MKQKEDKLQKEDKKRICYIVGACGFAKKRFFPGENDYIIAADEGYGTLIKEGFEPDLTVGDFDSFDINLVNHNKLSFSDEKDETDMLLAVMEGMKLGFKTFYLFGGIGGRLSHTLANIQTMRYIAEKGCRGVMIGEDVTIFIVANDTVSFDMKQSGYISVFALDKEEVSVTINGLKYEVENRNFTNSFPQGISNEFIGKESSISVKNGMVVVVIEHELGHKPERLLLFH